MNSLAHKLITSTDDSSFGNIRVDDECGLDFGGGETMTAGVDDVYRSEVSASVLGKSKD